MKYFEYPAWHNGRYCTVKDLNINIMDLGLIHSDATYDVIAFIDNQGLKLDEHLNRFLSSCEYWRIKLNFSRDELEYTIKNIHYLTGWDSSIVWISATRGISESGNPRDLTNCRSNVMCYAKPYQQFNGTNRATVCLSQQKRVPDSGVNQLHKNFVWSDLTRAQWEAIDRGFDTAVLLSTDGYLTEGPGFNVAIIKDDVVYAPRTNRLPGISMRLIEEVCQQQHIRFHWDDINQEKLESLDDMILTTTIGNLVTVTNFDGRQLKQSHIQKKLKRNIKC